MSITRENHYVPEWYQKRFLSSERNAFYYLNLSPSPIPLSDGTIKSHNATRWPLSPKQCFWQKDLYTTSYYGFINDEIERFLFGRIDNIGSRAVDAMAEQEFVRLHKNYENFFEYIDAQKIRTPKGLDWLRSKYPTLAHNQLLHEMQLIRNLHCTIWAEAVKEIVYANNSDIKFIISDHPVTIYNPACPPDSSDCIYPNDPRIEMKATQTLFPLDSNRCLIITNLDYARRPDLHDPKTFRPNSNPFHKTLIRMDNTIRKRQLQDSEVAMINFIIKARAKRYLAAENKSWLYPEKTIVYPWKELGRILLPPQDELYHFGGEIYVGYEDGSSSYHDEYGRIMSQPSYLKKQTKNKISPNDSCPCGSGKKYKKCCRDRAEDERPSFSERSIRERNIKLFEILSRIIGLDEGKDWADIRRDLTDQKIADIHKAVALLWPRETDIMSLLPRPDARVSRALYSGLLDPRVTYISVAPLLVYADEILMLNPFPNPNVIRKKYNPIDNPDQFRQTTIKNILFFMSFMPFIQAGYINLIPDPLAFNDDLREKIFAEAEKRRKEIKFDDQSMKSMEKLLMEDNERFLWNVPDDRIKGIIKSRKPGISQKDLEDVLRYIKKKNEQDPLAPLYPVVPKQGKGQMFVSHLSPNLEMGMFLAQATGSFIVTDNPHRWSEICSSINYFYGDFESPWQKLDKHLEGFSMDFIHCIDPRDLLELLKNGTLRDIKMVIRKIWNAVQVKEVNPSIVDSLIEELDAAKTKMDKSVEQFIKRKNEGCVDTLRVVRKESRLTSRIAPVGHSTSSVYRLLLTHAGHDKYLKSLPLSLYVEQQEIE